jgi:predicted RecB family nuclease
MTYGISKSRFQKGLQCEKALWLAVHRRDLATPPDETQLWIFEQGHEVGHLARRLFPGGVEVSEGHLQGAEALATTRRLIADGVRVLYEPAFEHDGAFVRVDILVGADDGSWDLYEVKSSTALKDEHVTDAAMQAWTLEGAGLRVRSVNVVHLNNTYVWDGGEYDLAALFTVEDVTAMAREFMPQVGPTLARFQQMLGGPEPDVMIGRQCTNPYTCDFVAYCHAALPEAHPITALPALSDEVLHALLRAGITSIADVPETFPGLSAQQREVVALGKRGEPLVDSTALAAELHNLAWPVRHLDFETVMPALPLWPGTRPYQAVPFQYSLHVHHADGRIEHRQYLHEGTDDPRRPLAERLLADLGSEGSILHYSAYEKTHLRALRDALPDLAPAFDAVLGRLVDLLPIVRRHMRHPLAAGSASIKQVLPAWCPDLTYDGLPIADGQTASVRYLRVLRGDVDDAEAASVRADLERYCALDTLAMSRLLEEMLRLSRNEADA